MPEKLAFQQSIRQSGTIYLHKRLIRTEAVVMNRVRNKVLACPAFTTKKNRCVAVGYLLDKPVNLFHRVTCTDHVVYIEVVFQLPAQARIFFA